MLESHVLGWLNVFGGYRSLKVAMNVPIFLEILRIPFHIFYFHDVTAMTSLENIFLFMKN